MCGITGIIAFSANSNRLLSKVDDSTHTLFNRGPDGSGIFRANMVALGHRRLSIVDTTTAGAQPMTDTSGRFVIVFNGEIFNYKSLKDAYFHDSDTWESNSDTELLLRLWIRFKEHALSLLQGFFAFAIYDKDEHSLFLARDRFGKKPLFYTGQPHEYFLFGSTLDALKKYDIDIAIDTVSLMQYLHLNYVPEPWSIIQDVKKLPPGYFLTLGKNGVVLTRWYKLTWPRNASADNYTGACMQLKNLLEASINDRLISDVPLGAFLSGGIDSSVVVALANQFTAKPLQTFSIGYRDNSFFDETTYALEVAKMYKLEHTVFSLRNDDFLYHLDNVLDSFDEPFADSSAIPLYILSYYTKQKVTVALSGDGGDEIFAGYNKHAAEMQIRSNSWKNEFVKYGAPLWRSLPQSRNNRLGNIIRQLNRFADGAKLNPKERYWRWAGFLCDSELVDYLPFRSANEKLEYDARKEFILNKVDGGHAIEDVLATDMSLVLLSDMLVKVDRMSMANGLEVRSPFLDHRVVEFAFSLPTEFKLGGGLKKRIVQDAFRDILPTSLYNRPKKGFEIPLLDWFRRELKSRITDDWLNDEFIKEQGIFHLEAVQKLKSRLFSPNPGDAHATTWALIVFQHWWKRTMS